LTSSIHAQQKVCKSLKYQAEYLFGDYLTRPSSKSGQLVLVYKLAEKICHVQFQFDAGQYNTDSESGNPCTYHSFADFYKAATSGFELGGLSEDKIVKNTFSNIYKGEIGRNTAEAQLPNKGDHLIRYSAGAGNYVLSINLGNIKKHCELTYYKGKFSYQLEGEAQPNEFSSEQQLKTAVENSVKRFDIQSKQQAMGQAAKRASKRLSGQMDGGEKPEQDAQAKKQKGKVASLAEKFSKPGGQGGP